MQIGNTEIENKWIILLAAILLIISVHVYVSSNDLQIQWYMADHPELKAGYVLQKDLPCNYDLICYAQNALYTVTVPAKYTPGETITMFVSNNGESWQGTSTNTISCGTYAGQGSCSQSSADFYVNSNIVGSGSFKYSTASGVCYKSATHKEYSTTLSLPWQITINRCDGIYTYYDKKTYAGTMAFDAECMTDSDCASNEKCSSYECDAIDCDSCEKAESHSCVSYGDCNSDSDCSTGYFCSSCYCEMSGDCVSNSDCSSGEFCNDDYSCQALPDCTSDSDCSSGYKCSSESCVMIGDCVSSSDCATDEFCNDDYSCQALPDCTLDSDCSSGYKCSSESCVMIGDCVEDTDCSTGESCNSAWTCELNSDNGTETTPGLTAEKTCTITLEGTVYDATKQICSSGNYKIEDINCCTGTLTDRTLTTPESLPIIAVLLIIAVALGILFYFGKQRGWF